MRIACLALGRRCLRPPLLCVLSSAVSIAHHEHKASEGELTFLLREVHLLVLLRIVLQLALLLRGYIHVVDLFRGDQEAMFKQAKLGNESSDLRVTRLVGDK